MNIHEIWVQVNEFPNYFVSNLGNVKSNRKNKKNFRNLKFGKRPNGYLFVVLYNDLGKKTISIHRLVLNAFNAKKNISKLEVNHIDGNKTNNKLENLEWCSRQENEIHSYKVLKKKPSCGEINGHSKLNNSDIFFIKILSKHFKQKFISQFFGVRQDHISRIINNKQWFHLVEK